VVETVGTGFVTVVGPKVVICAVLYLFGEQFDNVSSKKRVSDSSSRAGSNFVRRW
jgi:hypothetical protein